MARTHSALFPIVSPCRPASVVFVCQDPPVDGIRYLSADLSVACFSGAHLSSSLGAAGVLAGYALGFPAAVVAVFRGRELRRSYWRRGVSFLGGLRLSFVHF